ncbi:hypothetical protein AAF712_014682 [Marasmius tenuissimus]|uniref:Uncharacterized protein n=1 Tax=Marasmius tenuissimus TaxID=585030 RepID=A0ABR2ZCK8_9AGAR
MELQSPAGSKDRISDLDPICSKIIFALTQFSLIGTVDQAEINTSTSHAMSASIAAVVKAIGRVGMAFVTAIVLVTGDIIDADISGESPRAETRKRGVEIAAPSSGPSMIFVGFADRTSIKVCLLLLRDPFNQFMDGQILVLKLLGKFCKFQSQDA